MVIPCSQGGGDGDIDNRFAHLLQPIRDLAKNWDVDIASGLEDYLGEIEKIAITFDGGTTTMNFAEAALLIQGSACIYSKKVEYLYALVYQVLDLLASKKKQKASSIDKDGNDADAPVDDEDKDEEFLTLDDIKEHKNIDMKCDDDDNIHAVAAMPRTPLALIPLEDGEKGEHPLLSRTGEVLGSRRDFKMNTCNIHLSGTMLLDMSHLSLLEASFCTKPCSTPFVPRIAALQLDSEKSDVQDIPVDEGLHEVSLDDDHAGIDDDLPNMEEDPLPGNQEDEAGDEVDRMEMRPRRENVKAAPPAKPLIDVWAPLDPHATNTAPEKPFKKSRTFRVPTCLETETSKKRKRKKSNETKSLQPIAEFCASAYHSCDSKFPSNQLKVPDFPEFEHLYWLEFRRRQAKLRRERKMLVQQGRLVELAEDEQQQEEIATEGDAPAFGDDGDEDPGGFDEGPQEDVLLDPLQMSALLEQQTPLAQAPPPCLDGSHIVSSYEQLVRNHVEGYLASAQQYAQITELSRRVAEWEEKIAPRLKSEEERESFDIHKYGSRVLETFPEKDEESSRPEPLPFRKVVENRPPEEVSRLFLATLQLANNYNVEIGNSGSLQVDTMTIKLLSKRRQFEELLEYRAPSIQD